MTRWHKALCPAPDIVIEQGCPRCKACDSVANVDKLIQQQKSASPFSPPPEDESPEQLNLYWPSSVSYIPASTPPTVHNSVPINKEPPPASSYSSQAPSSIYPSRLGPEQFRLLYLSAVADSHDLVHAELDVHELERCPEYEATSYTWAGDDGNNSLCKPIFVGPYWDILLQTRNCWSMLQLMRPHKGFRLVWVDAICINQKDVEERDAQVTRMCQIYSACTKVFVFLGPDISTPVAGGHQYPLRRPLPLLFRSDQCKGQDTDDETLDLRSLLEQRYFSRVWVIQELILSRQATIRVKNVEFRVDAQMMHSIKSNPQWNWRNTAAPWLEHLGQGRFEDKDLYEILRAVSKSQCGDPRDKIFGILALAGDGPSARGLQANYRLSTQHAFIGVFSHILVNLRRASLLYQTAGMEAWGKHPSWVPPWNTPNPEWIFRYPDARPAATHRHAVEAWWKKSGSLRPYSHDITFAGMGNKQVVNRPRWGHIPMPAPLPGRMSTRSPGPRPVSWAKSMTRTSLFHLSPEPKRWKTDAELQSELRAYYSGSSRGPGAPKTDTATLNTKVVPEERPGHFDRLWHQGMVITTNGRLSINLIHLLQFYAAPSRVPNSDGLSLFTVQSTSMKRDTAALYLLSNSSLDECVLPQHDHLFMLDGGQSSSFYLIMRQLNDPNTFRIVASCDHVMFQVRCRSTSTRKEEEFVSELMCDRRFSQDQDLYENVAVQHNKSVFLADLQHTLSEILRDLSLGSCMDRDQKSLSSLFLARRTMGQLSKPFSDMDQYESSAELLGLSLAGFKPRLERFSIMPAFQGLFNEARGSTPGFLDSYVKYLPESLFPEVRGDFVHVILDFDIRDVDLDFKMVYQSSNDTDHLQCKSTSENHTHLRASNEDLQHAFKQTLTYRYLSELTPVVLETGESEVEMATRARGGPNPARQEDSLVLVSRWPKIIMRVFNIDGKTQKVHIV